MIDVYWHKGRRLCYDQTFIDETFSGPDFRHHNRWELGSYDGYMGGIVVIPGIQCMEERNEIPYVREALKAMKWAVVLVTGDEQSLVDHHQLELPHTRVWIMSPVQGKHEGNRFLMNGSWPRLHETIKKLGFREKKLDWMFAGQVTHARRAQCVEQLRRLPNGFLLETAGFLQGVPAEEYYGAMLQAKVVPCPSGPVELSTARICEAIECGCVPIVDGVTPHPEYWNAPKPGYWEWFFGGKLPFPVIYDWKDFPRILAETLEKWPFKAAACLMWWNLYKEKLYSRLLQDVEELRNGK